MKKSQIYGQIFIYVLSIVLISFIMVYGYNAIQKMRDRGDELCLLKLKNDLNNMVKSVSEDFGSTRIKAFRLCESFKQICFVENVQNPTPQEGINPLIRDEILSETGNNVFLVQNIKLKSYSMGKISVEPDVLCFDAINSEVKLKFDGKGNYVEITQ